MHINVLWMYIYTYLQHFCSNGYTHEVYMIYAITCDVFRIDRDLAVYMTYFELN